MDNIGGSKLNNVLKAKEDLLKSPEELESEKRHTISQRVGKLDINMSENDLRAQVLKNLYLNLTQKTKIKFTYIKCEVYYEALLKTFEMVYLLGEKFKRQQYDVKDL